MTRTYSQVILLPNFNARFEYLKLNGIVSEITFGNHRYLNQSLYASYDWKRVRRKVIIRDDACDLADPERPIVGRVLIHHIEPITIDDILEHRKCVFDMDNLICVSFDTHNALHYSDANLLPKPYISRSINDTCPWR